MILSEENLLNLFDNFFFIKLGFYIPFVQSKVSDNCFGGSSSTQKNSPMISKTSKFVSSQEFSGTFVIYEVDEPVILLKQTGCTNFIYFKFFEPVIKVKQPLESKCNDIELNFVLKSQDQKVINLLSNRQFDLYLSFPLLTSCSKFYNELYIVKLVLNNNAKIFILYQSFDELRKAIILRCEIDETSIKDDKEQIIINAILAELGNIELHISINTELTVLSSYCFPELISVEIVNESYFIKKHNIDYEEIDDYYYCYKMKYNYENLQCFHLNTDNDYQAYYSDEKNESLASSSFESMKYCLLKNSISSEILFILTKEPPNLKALHFVYSFQIRGNKINADCELLGQLYTLSANFELCSRVLGGAFYKTTNNYITNSENELISNKTNIIKEHQIFLEHNDTANLMFAQNKEYTIDNEEKVNSKNYEILKQDANVYRVKPIANLEEVAINDIDVECINCLVLDQVDIFKYFTVEKFEKDAQILITIMFKDSEFQSELKFIFE